MYKSNLSQPVSVPLWSLLQLLSPNWLKVPTYIKLRSAGVKEPCSRLPGPQVPGLESPGFWDGGLTLECFSSDMIMSGLLV